MDVRPTIASFAPTMWGNTFTSFSADMNKVQEEYAEAIEALKEDARSLLVAKGNRTADRLILIDTFERLGVAYHFEQEIEDQLQDIFKLHSETEDDYDLFITALQFRLLRQHRHFVSSRVFDKFMSEDNKLKETLKDDVKGLLSLYEAAHLKIHGEAILEEAVVFTTHHLKLILQQSDQSPLQDQVKRALQQSLHRGVSRIETRHYISFYERDDSKNELLLKLAKLDFNYVQNLYKKELHELARWWNEVDLKSKLPYARDRLVESYFWGVAIHFKPQDSYARLAVGKSIQIIATINDTYDRYATLEEADLFNEILERWDINEIDGLPNYMKIVYKFILSIYDDYEIEASKQGKSYAVSYAKETVKQLCKAYNKVQKWAMGQQTPTFEEYVANMMFTSSIYLILSSTIPGMKSASKQTIDWLMGEPKIVSASATIGRYSNDLGSYERENKGGRLPTAVRCYMKQYGVSKEEALDEFVELVEDAWKDLNTEWITETSVVPKDMAEQLLNVARASEVTYVNRQDGYSDPETYLAPQLVALFVNPILI
ncbi:Cis-muuroladiene synthase [Sesamum alatum]|uniref:Cis-muuroladiene synthase n=1 Tax=Sesamum alatum TaxID=300844 RepID=A0AAE1XX14_9LAMI|nr:Cis-muuroladiene synthase [Sesamum alatum]